MREFLKGLELEKEVIDKIMGEYGKQVSTFKEQLEDYKTKEAQKDTELESYKTQIDNLNKTIEEKDNSLKDLQTITTENDDLKAQIQISGANVKKEFEKFVTSEVRGMVDEKTDFSKALENYKKDNPQYFGETVIKKVQTSPELAGGDVTPQTTNNIMNDILRGARK